MSRQLSARLDKLEKTCKYGAEYKKADGKYVDPPHPCICNGAGGGKERERESERERERERESARKRACERE